MRSQIISYVYSGLKVTPKGKSCKIEKILVRMVQWGAPKGKGPLGATTTKIEEPIEERYKNGWAGYWLSYFGDRKREVAGIIFESMILMVEYKEK